MWYWKWKCRRLDLAFSLGWFLLLFKVIIHCTFIFIISTCVLLKSSPMESVMASAVRMGEFFVPSYVQNWPCMYAVASPVILTFLSNTAINCIVCSEVININVIYHLESSKNKQMTCFVQWGVDPFRNFDLKLFFFFFLLVNMKSTTISQVFSYLIFWGISHSCLWHFPVGCSFASSLIRFSQRNVVGSEEHTVRPGLCLLQALSSDMHLNIYQGSVCTTIPVWLWLSFSCYKLSV